MKAMLVRELISLKENPTPLWFEETPKHTLNEGVDFALTLLIK
jgi:hypothetical protein